MKKAIYLIAWVVLTATDAILGYKTATTDFGIKEPILAIVWALGFSLLSVPAKLIYERLIEDAYKNWIVAGKVIFTLFSVFWVWIAYNAYTGVSDFRRKDMIREQLSQIKQSEKVSESETVEKSETIFDYRLSKMKLKIKEKQDSINFAEKREFRNQQMQLIQSQDGNGFLFFNLLLILSASICLSLAFDSETKKTSTESVLIPKTNKYQRKQKEATETLENSEKSSDGVLSLKELANITPYHCNSCQKTFNNRFGYNAHMRYNEICEKGNYQILSPT
jgi:hypothetical protein